jgi:hypothetical protein
VRRFSSFCRSHFCRPTPTLGLQLAVERDTVRWLMESEDVKRLTRMTAMNRTVFVAHTFESAVSQVWKPALRGGFIERVSCRGVEL